MYGYCGDCTENQNGNRYQLVYDENEPGQAKPPTFTDEEGERRPMAYVNGGSYSFQMPEANTELNAEYVKVTTELAITPKETVISVIQTRTGDRKQPQIMTEVKDQEGRLIAKYLNGSENSEVSGASGQNPCRAQRSGFCGRSDGAVVH